MSRRLATWVALAAFLTAGSAQESSRPGPVFEKWVRDVFFEAYRPAASAQRWDIPAAANRAHGEIPVGLLSARHGEAVDLGGALLQYEIDEPFMLIIGFWQADGAGPRIVNIVAPEISPALWRQLWGPVTYTDLLRLDALIKDTGPSIEETRRRALRVKNAPPFTEAVIQVNPKIDGQGQRRLQCSIRFSDVFKYLAPGADPLSQDQPALFGVAYPAPAAAKPRSP